MGVKAQGLLGMEDEGRQLGSPDQPGVRIIKGENNNNSKGL